jgi:hypothetical protein
MDAGAWLWLGKTRLAQDKIEQATKDIQQALDIDKRYVAAHRALADVYERTERSEEAAELRTKAYELEKTLRKLAIFGPEFRNDLAPSRLGLTEGFDRTMGAAKAFDSRVPSPDVITDQVRAAAEERRQELLPWREEVKICEAASVVPVLFRDAEEAYSRSSDLVEAEDYEVAACGFGQARALYQTALEEFARVAGRDHELWLNWAEERAESDSSTRRRASVWLILAEARHRAGDSDGYREAMEHATSCIRVGFTVKPGDGADAMLRIAYVQLRCDDRDGAQSSAREAATFCDGIQTPGRKCFRLARCVGLLARLGETEQWNRLMPLALVEARKVSSRPRARDREVHPQFIKSIAYAEDLASDPALTAVEAMQGFESSDYGPRRAERAAPAYASVALAAAKSSDGDSAEQVRIFDRSYASACTQLAALLEVQPHHADLPRQRLADADAHLGHFDRAWVNATNIANPHKRNVTMMRILAHLAEAERWSDVLEFGKSLPLDAAGSEGLLWLAEARVRAGSSSMVGLKKWAEGQSSAVGRSAALAGIAVGVKHTVETQPRGDTVGVKPGEELAANDQDAGGEADSVDPLGPFDADAAADRQWWFDRASALAEKVADPVTRGWAWLQLASAYQDAEDKASFHSTIAAAVHCTAPTWSQILERRGRAQRRFGEESYIWRLGSREKDAEESQINALVRLLLAIEEAQYEASERRGASDTLLLALKCVEPMPRQGGYAAPVDARLTWLARIAGRARRRDHPAIAGAMMAGYPWSHEDRKKRDEKFLLGLAASEARDVWELTRWAEDRPSGVGATRERLTYVALLQAELARLAAERGDEDAYRQAAMQVGGLVNRGGNQASQSVLLPLAEATAKIGQPDVARDYAAQSRVRGPERERVQAAIAIAMVREGFLSDARELLDQTGIERAKLPARYALAKAEAAQDTADLEAIFQALGELRGKGEQAAALAGVAAGLSSP